MEEANTTGGGKHQANQPEAPPTVFTTRVDCVHYSNNSYLIEQKMSDPHHSSSDKTLKYNT